MPNQNFSHQGFNISDFSTQQHKPFFARGLGSPPSAPTLPGLHCLPRPCHIHTRAVLAFKIMRLFIYYLLSPTFLLMNPSMYFYIWPILLLLSFPYALLKFLYTYVY